ncbi:MAG: cell division protein ZipA [Gammaproteobacteria bacterium]|nr:MAG: cell division protein ZipA [Gammaproteobacteria bacterium]
MDDLRLILVSIGAVALLGIYLWGVRHKHKGSRYKRLDEINPEGLDDLPVTQPVPAAVDEPPVDDSPDTLSNKADIEPAEEIVPAPPPKPIPEPVLGIAPEKTSSKDVRETLRQLSIMVRERDESVQVGLSQDMFANEPDEVVPREYIVINVAAMKGQAIAGPELLMAMKNAGMKHGEMDIFHGLMPDSNRERAMFSIANMVEPGVFKLENINELVTPGVVMFMGLPSPMDNLECFEAMLAAAHVLAEEMGGRILDESRSTLTKQGEDAIRDRIRQFDLHDGARRHA